MGKKRKSTTSEYVGITDSYHKYYKKKYENTVSISEYRRVLNAFHQLVMKHVIEDGDLVYLPLRLGVLCIKGIVCKPRLKNGRIIGIPIRWSKTRELWEGSPEARERKQLVYCTNEHTGGVRYKFLWNTYKVFARFKNLYTFRASRANKRAVYKAVLNGKEYEDQFC